MEEISKGFEFNDDTEDGHKMILYSAFFSYDELINCIISVIAFVAGLTLHSSEKQIKCFRFNSSTRSFFIVDGYHSCNVRYSSRWCMLSCLLRIYLFHFGYAMQWFTGQVCRIQFLNHIHYN